MSDFDSGRVDVNNTPLPVSGTVNVGNTPLPVSGTVTASNLLNPHPVIGPLTDTQLRATPVPVSGTVAVSGVASNVIVDFPPNTPRFDLFGRFRISAPESLFASIFLYDKLPLLWDEAITGTATSTLAAPYVLLATTTASGDRVIRQTKEYFSYEPDRAQQVAFTFVFGEAKANCVQTIGVYDANDGLYIQLSGTTFQIGERSSFSGSPVDTVVTRANFNIDKLDGTGPSGMTIDLTKTQLMFIEYQWFGVGTIRYGVLYNDQIFYFHKTHHANILTNVYMKRGSLPVRYEIQNTGTTSGATTLKQICCAIQSEAGYKPTGIKRSVDTGTSVRVAGAGVNLPALSIRLKSTHNRATIIPLYFSTVASTLDNFRYQIILNGSLTGASFNSVGTDSIAEYDIAASAITGGTLLTSGFASSQNRTNFDTSIASLLKLVANIAGTSDIITLAITGLSGGGVSTFSSLEWSEYV